MAQIKHLVLDTAPIIHGTFTKDVAEKFYVVPEVLSEIRDSRSKAFFDNLLADISVLSPSSSSVQDILSFSKKTGDFPVLSTTDIKVMALTLELERKFNPKYKLRSEPDAIQTVTPSQSFPVNKNFPEINSLKLDENSSPLNSSNTDGNSSENPLSDSSNSDSESASNSSDDEDGWITPQNINSVNEEETSNDNVEDEPVVACASNDFAMQNTLIHMGLNVIGASGYLIRELKSYVLRCHVCYEITKDMSKVFCQACGHNSLLRTSYSIDSDGKMKIYLKNNFQFNIRGTKYSIPNPVGKNKPNMLIFAEDQKEYIREQKKVDKALKKTFQDEDFIDSFFDRKMLPNKVKIGHGKKNINAVKKKTSYFL